MLKGVLSGHAGSVTCLATNSENPGVLISGSRGKLFSVSGFSATFCFVQNIYSQSSLQTKPLSHGT